MPFVVEFREDVDLRPGGAEGVADFVNVGIVEDAHGSHVAGIAAGNDLFGGRADGAAPGARLVSARACTWGGGCTAAALTEAMIDLVVNRRVDVVNMSIGGLPALNDGNNARATLYDRLIDDFGVQLFISAGNSGPGVNTVGDPSVATAVVSVGASISRQTWAADYGAEVSKDRQVFTFSSRGPRENGGFKPDVLAPGAAISTIPLWQPGAARRIPLRCPLGPAASRWPSGTRATPPPTSTLTVLLGTVVVGSSADGDSEESAPRSPRRAPGTYTVRVEGYAVPGGTTAYDYRDVFYDGSLGSVDVPGTPRPLPNGAAVTVPGTVTARAAPATGRQLFGEMRLRTPEGAVVGRGGVLVRRVATG